jgi:hypothetical protein
MSFYNKYAFGNVPGVAKNLTLGSKTTLQYYERAYVSLDGRAANLP